MNKILLYTVPGTGTRFLSHILETVWGFRGGAYSDLAVVGSERVYALMHAPHKEQLVARRALNLPQQVEVVSSLRHPAMAFITRHYGHKETMSRCVARWDNLQELSRQRPITFIPVDQPWTIAQRVGLVTATALRMVDDAPTFGTQAEAFAHVVNNWPQVGSEGMKAQHHEFLGEGVVVGLNLEPLARAVLFYNAQVARARAQANFAVGADHAQGRS